MARLLQAPRRIRGDSRGAAEMMQVMQAVLVSIVCVGIVFAALSAHDAQAEGLHAHERAFNQATVFVEALPYDPALTAGGGAISWEEALAVAGGALRLSFVPKGTCAASLLDVQSGTELFLIGRPDTVLPPCVLVKRPVSVAAIDGTLHAGMLTAGVALQ